jgi:hypothetical protein
MSYNQLTIIDLVNQCSYNSNTRPYITNILIEMTKNPSTKLFKIKRNIQNHEELIMMIRYNIPTLFKNKTYDIPILIYIPSTFPYDGPEFYVEKAVNVEVNPNNTDIDISTSRIIIKSLRNWSISSNILNIIGEINSSFNTTFPIYQIKTPEVRKSIESLGKSGEFKQQIQVNPQENNAKQILIEAIRISVKTPIYEEIKKLNKQSEIIKNYKNVFISQNEQFKVRGNSKEVVINYFQNLFENINNDINTLNNEIDINRNNVITSANFADFIKISEDRDDKIIKAIVMEAAIDDFITIIKKAFEKQLINFSETVKIIRSLTRESFNIKFYKNNINIKK